MFCEELEEFFTNWKNRVPQKLLLLTVITGNTNKNVKLELNEKNMKNIIEKYTKMGILKKFEIKNYDDDDDDEY